MFIMRKNPRWIPLHRIQKITEQEQEFYDRLIEMGEKPPLSRRPDILWGIHVYRRPIVSLAYELHQQLLVKLYSKPSPFMELLVVSNEGGGKLEV